MNNRKRLTIPDIRSRKGDMPLVVLTAYSAPVAKVVDSYSDIVLVGDSVGMVLYGMPNPLSVTVEMMIAHGRAVVNASTVACVVVDMPFGSYQASKEQAFVNAARIMADTGCTAVKLEGGKEMAETISYLVERGVPVMAHVGMQPQSMNRYGGFKAQGKDDAGRKRILEDALAVEKAGAFAVVLEAIYDHVAEEITAKLSIPTIGIGAGLSCDGQVLVTEDMAGVTMGPLPRFVKRYAHLSDDLSHAAKNFSEEVKNRSYPTAQYSYGKGEEKAKKKAA